MSQFRLQLRTLLLLVIYILTILNYTGWGTDEKSVIEILGHRNVYQRQQIRKSYQEIYQEDILKRLESELSGDFEVH